MSPPHHSNPTKSKGKPPRKKSIKEIRAEMEKKDSGPGLIVMNSETQSVLNVEEKDRAGRINIAVGMVVADMKALQGSDSARKAALSLNSDKMREHVGRLCDKTSRRRKECQSDVSAKAEVSTVSVPPLTASVDVTHVPTQVQQTQPIPVVPAVEKPKEVVQTKASALNQNAVSQKDIVSDYSKSLELVLARVADEIQSKGLRDVPGVSRSNGANHNIQGKKKPKVIGSKGTGKRVRSTAPPSTKGVVIQPPQKVPYQTTVDLQGFSNDNISLDLDGRRVIVVAYRPKDSTNHARKVTEIIEIPEGVAVDNLKVARRPDGSLIIEEVLPEGGT